MYCPEDGQPIIATRLGPGNPVYPPCSSCGIQWAYNGEEGCYRVSPDLSERTLEAIGADRRGRALDVLVANIVDTMEKEAEKGQPSTYYTGTFAVAPCTIVHAGLTCERDPNFLSADPEIHKLRWTAFFGDDWEHLTRMEAIKHLLAERS